MKDDSNNLQEVALIDEVKRRNRRRLVGAIVLVVIAIVFVPKFLEKEPAPLGDNVEIVIPPVAGTKLPEAVPPAIEPVAPPETVTKEPPKEVSEEEPKDIPKEAPKDTPKEPPKKQALPPAVAFAKGTFSVQLAAFTDDKGANALVNRVKQAGYPAYNEPTDTARGIAWRVRVGPYKTREDAAAVRSRLKKDSYDGMVVPAR